MGTGTKAGAVLLYISGAVSSAVCFSKWGISGRSLIACIFLLFLTFAAVEDVRAKRIPDRIVLGIGAAGALSVPFFAEIGLVSRGIGFLEVSVPLLIIILTIPGSFGGGDVKLMAASGIFLGGRCNVEAFVLAVFIAGAYCVWMLLRRKTGRREQIAFGPFLCMGIMIEMMISNDFCALVF